MSWWQRLTHRRQMEEQLEKELRFHLEKHTNELIARGVDPAEARRLAHLEIGGAEQVKEQCRDARGTRWLEDLVQDVRYALRTLCLKPGFAAVAVLTLALGIGANTAIFQLLDAVRIRTLPVENPQQLREINIDKPKGRSGSFLTRYPALTAPIWQQIRDNQKGFSGMLAWAPWPFNIAESGEVQNVDGMWVSGEFFSVLNVRPIMGRLFSTADDTAGCSGSGAVISYAFWQSEFGGQPDVLGKQVHVDHHAFQIIGVTPQTFYGIEVGRAFQIALPICSEPIVRGEQSGLNNRSYWWLTVVGRLRPGWSDQQAAAQLRAISPSIFEATVPTDFDAEEAKHFRGYKLGVFPAATGSSELRRNYEDPLELLLGLAGLVLLIACGNLANLMLARGSARGREMAVRMAIGASRSRLIRQLLTESLLIAAAGAGAGVLLARWLSGFLISFLSTQQNPLFVDLGTDWRVLAFTGGVAALVCVLIGVTPAIRATSVAPGAALKMASRGLTAGPERFGIRRVLVISQVALSLVLVTGALLFARSLVMVTMQNPGFVQDKILVADVDYSRMPVPDSRKLPVQLDLIERIRQIPGITAVASSSIALISGSSWNQAVLYDPQGKNSPGETNLNEVSDGFFKTMSIPFIAGRDFNTSDTPHTPRVVIINQEFAKRYFPNQNPIGRRFSLKKLDPTKDESSQVVGLVGDTKYDDMHSSPPPLTYLPLSQDDNPDKDVTLMIHSAAPLDSLRPAITETVKYLHPDLHLQVLRTTIEESLLSDRLMAMLSGFFGGLAALLAMIGVYGVISYTVAGRQNEFGIRMALGAQRRDIVTIVMREAVVLLTIGIGIGAVLALIGSKQTASLLYGLKPYDPLTFLLAIMCLSAIAAVASGMPAIRASRTDPMAALHDE